MYSGGYGMGGGMGGMGGGYGGGYGGSMGMGGMGMRSNSMMGMGGLGMRSNSMYGNNNLGGGGMGYGGMNNGMMNDGYDQQPGAGGLLQQNGMRRPGTSSNNQQQQQQRPGTGAQAQNSSVPRRTGTTTVSRTNAAPSSGNATSSAGASKASEETSGNNSLPAGLNQTPMNSSMFDSQQSNSAFDMEGSGIDWQDGGGTNGQQQQGGPQQQQLDDQQQQQMQPQISEEEHTMQRRTFVMQSLLELSQLFAQILQPLTQFLSLGFGSYMGISSIRSQWSQGQAQIGGGANEFLAQGPQQQAPQLPGAEASSGGALATRGAAASGDLSFKSKLALGILTALLFMLVERVYQRYFGVGAQNAARENEIQRRRSQQGNQVQSSQQGTSRKAITTRKQIYVAQYDYHASADNQLSFKAGDRFIVERYDSQTFVAAEKLSLGEDPLDVESSEKRSETREGERVAVGASAGAKKGLIPGNYIEPLSLRHKF